MRWLSLLVVGAACGTPALISTTSDYAVGESALDFGRVWVGFPAEQRLEILSRSRQPASLPVSVEGPFSVELAIVELGGGDTAGLAVRFAPQLAGAAAGTLHVGDLAVSLAGEGVVPPGCEPDTACRHRAFDPVAGACVDQPLADGTACADACLEHGRCLSGECFGTARSCDDHDACTRDACAPATGCVHTDTTAECGAIADACHAPACDPATGCTAVPVADGTPCGQVSCVLADVCLQGRCVAVTPPDGFECAPPSPCQAPGACQAQQCVRPPPQALSPAWSYAAPQDSQLLFEGVTDPSGNLWWLECAPGQTQTCTAVSYTKDGFPRVRGGALSGLPYPTAAQLFDEGRFVFGGSNGVVVALDGLTGAELWRTDTLAALSATGTPLATLGLLQLTSDGHGHVWVSAPQDELACGDVASVTALVELDAATGAIRARTPADLSGSPVADEQGNLFATRAVQPAELASWSPQGVQRFSAPAVGGTALVAAEQGLLVMASNRVFASVDGVELSSGNAFGVLRAAALRVGSQTIRLRRISPPLPVAPATDLALFDAANPAGRSLALAAGPSGVVTMPVMAQQDTVVVAGQFQVWAQPSIGRLLGVTTAGVERFSCQLADLPGFAEWGLGAKAAFTGDRFALAYQPICRGCLRSPEQVIRVFDTTGLGAATSGWVSPRGTPGNAGHPR